MTVQELAMPKTNAFILDAREKEEYNTSHLKNAIFVGYSTFELDSVLSKIQNKNSEIVVYCSIGIRSETIASKLKKAGYSNGNPSAFVLRLQTGYAAHSIWDHW